MKLIVNSQLLPMILLIVTAQLICIGCGPKGRAVEVAKAADNPSALLSKNHQIVFGPKSPKLTQLQVEIVTEEIVSVDEITAPGKVEENPNHTSHIALPVPGRVSTVSARIGDFVRVSQPLLTIESPDVDMALSAHLQAMAGVIQSQSAVTKAQADLDRLRDLFAHNAAAQKEVINAATILIQAKASLEQAEAALKQAQRRLAVLRIQPGQFGQQLVVTAPISGKVLEMSVVRGEYRNDVNQPVITIADLSTVWITADVPESSIRFVKVGSAVRIELSAYPGEAFYGKVRQLADVVDTETRTIKVRAEILNRDGRLRPEMFGRIRLLGAQAVKPVVPATSIVEREGEKVVWRETAPGTFERTPVTIGQRSDERIAILTGLKSGDKVVIDGAMLLPEHEARQ